MEHDGIAWRIEGRHLYAAAWNICGGGEQGPCVQAEEIYLQPQADVKKMIKDI